MQSARGLTITAVVLAIIGGLLSPWLLPAALWPQIGTPHTVYLMLAGAGLLLVPWLMATRAQPHDLPRAGAILVLAFLGGALWTASHALSARADQLDPALEDMTLTITGRVADLPRDAENYQRFLLHPDDGQAAGLPDTLLVYWYDPRDTATAPRVGAGEQWRLTLRLRPPRGRVNFHGFDFERWLFSKRVGALATVRPNPDAAPNQRLRPARGYWLPRLRAALAERLETLLQDHPAAALITALAIGERGDIETGQWADFRATGTAHLVAISGLHVGLAAAFGYWLGRLLFGWFPAGRWSPIQWSWALSLASALAYALLAGLVVSASRAFVMLAVFSAALLLRRTLRPWAAYRLALLLVLLIWPLAPLGAGFWLSFAAVGLLIYGFHGRPRRRLPVMFLRAQWIMLVGLLPWSLWWFQQASVVAWLANLVAIPVVSVLVVPGLLLALLLSPWSTLATPLLAAVAWVLSLLGAYLQYLAQWPVASVHWPGAAMITIVLATAGALLLLAPRGLPGRPFGLLLMLPLILTGMGRGVLDLQPADWRLTLLDVGQGLAAVVETRHHVLLYDTGPGDGAQRHLVEGVIRPNLPGGAPDLLLVSHGDADHAGGLRGFHALYPDVAVIANLPPDQPVGGVVPHQACRTPLSWNWDGVDFQVLHPGPGLPYLGNDSSCVLRVGGAAGVLLPGDISEAVEDRLLREPDLLTAATLLLPHHGSKTSSSAAFIDAVAPDRALVSTAHLNRFGFPATAVRDRLTRRGIILHDTAACGALRLSRQDGGQHLHSARRVRAGLWRQPPDPNCP